MDGFCEDFPDITSMYIPPLKPLVFPIYPSIFHVVFPRKFVGYGSRFETVHTFLLVM